ncbi:alpha/beta hydrolase [Bradyrhizobium sp. UFLA01-814]|uniref:alpha/beta fold hydrolase n=1 Tax=Bradyrhizobium sp. UFLA01-814 TaxID=3023480 RepID=UPI00398AC7AD
MNGSISSLAETRYLDLGNARIAYRQVGPANNIPLVMCQRFRATIDHWDPALLDVLAAERSVVIFDNVGVGFSSGLAADNIADMAASANLFLEALGYEQCDLLGWSLGGTVTQQLALDHPRRVRRIVLAGTSPGGVPESPKAPDKVWQVAGKPVNDDEDFLYLFFTDSQTSRELGVASLRRLDLRLRESRALVKLESVQRQAAAISAWGAGKGSAFQRLHEIKAPTFVANGAHDKMTHAYNSYVMSQLIPSAQLVLYPDAGHGFLFQCAELFGRHVLEFLAA